MPTRTAASLVVLVLASAVPAAAAAQPFCEPSSPSSPSTAPTCSRDHMVVATVGHILRLDLSTLTTTMLAPARAQFDSARLATSPDQLPLTTGPVVTVHANRPWVLKVMAASRDFTFDPDPRYQVARPTGKPAGDLAWSTRPERGFLPLSPSAPADVASNAAAGSYAQHVIYFRTRWVYAQDVPGLYGLYVTFTLTGS